MSRPGKMRAAAHNVLHAMASGLAHDGTAFFTGHLAAAAAQDDAEQIQVDLIAGTVNPEHAGTPGLTRYAAAWRERWPAIVAGVGIEPSAVAKLWIAAQCDLSTREARRRIPRGRGRAHRSAYLHDRGCVWRPLRERAA
jgi:hypothetical protein